MVATASDLFGGVGSSAIFSIGLSTPAQPAQQSAKVAIDAAKAEINTIRGYKPRLTLAENQRLSKIQEEIQVLDRKASDGTIRQDEIQTRSELFLEADVIIGKPSANVESDSTLEGFREQIDELLAAKLDPPRARRLETLEKYKENVTELINNGDTSGITRARLQNVSKQISDLAPPRTIQSLSVTEKAEYDRLVEQVNNYAGAKIVLNARESIRVFNLQKTIDDLSSSLPPDQSGQPTASEVAQAYARIG